MAVAPEIEAPAAAALPSSPYVGLVPFGEDDAAFFFGRSTEIAIVAANLRASRLTILYGPSGVGKSSLLMAGVMHRLREDAAEADEETAFAVCAYRSWRGSPLEGIQATVQAALADAAGDGALPPPAATLADTLRAWTDETGTLLLALDQFEEYFQYHADESEQHRLTGFAAELARIVNDSTLTVHVLLSIREDAWAKLDRFKGRIPSLFANYLRVDHLDPDAAREAIEGPIEAWNRAHPDDEPYTIEPALTQGVIDAAAGGGLTMTGGGDRPAVEEAPGDRVEAPFLQLVLERLWRATVADGAHAVTVARLQQLGGARRIVENHLLDALARLTPRQRDIASDCFRFLVSSSKTKIAHPAADLAEWTKQPEPEVEAVLDMLCSGESGRILRAVAPVQGEGSTSYELFHDVLAEPILAWRRNYEAERSRRAFRRRVLRVGGILVGLVALFAALGVWALLQRSDARDATKSATSVALASAANDQLQARVDQSLMLGLAAYEAGHTVQAKSAMLSALEAARRSGGNASLVGHIGAVRGAAFSPNGATVASAGTDDTVRLWSVSTRTEIGQPLRGHTESVLAVAYSPDGTMLASGGDDRTVRLWNARARRSIGRPMQGDSSVLSVAFSPDGRLVASGEENGTVRLWDVGTQREVGLPLRGHTDSVESVAFSPNGKLLASASDDGTMLLWNVRTQRKLGRPFVGDGSSIWSVAFSPNGKLLASADYGKAVRLWSVRTHRELGPPLLGHTSPVDSVAFSPDGTILASASNDKTVRLWSVRTHKPIGRPFRGHTGIVYSVAFSPDGKMLASASDDATVRLWNLHSRIRLGAPLLGHTKSVQAVAFSPNGTVLASSGDDRTIRLWNVQTQKPIGRPLAGGTDSVYGLAFNPSGSVLASASWDGTVRLWNMSTHREIGRPFGDGSGSWNGVAFSPDGKMLATAGQRRVRLWSVSTHEPIGAPLLGDTDAVASVAFSPKGDILASGSWDGTLRLWNVQTHEQIGRPMDDHSGVVYSVAFSPDGSMVATADKDTALRLWDVRTHRRIGQPLKGHTDEAQSVAFSPDGTMLASGSVDQTVRLWDVKTHRELGQPLTGHTESVYAVAFSPDGTRLASGGADDTVRLWNGILWRNTADLQYKVCKLAVANLTKVEWQVLAPGIAYRKPCPGLP
jgi:WD40 repeat protein